MEYVILIIAVVDLFVLGVVYTRRVRRLERRRHALEIRVIERTRKVRREHDELLKVNRAFDDARGGSQSGQKRVSGRHESRNQNAAECDSGLCADSAAGDQPDSKSAIGLPGHTR